MLQKVCLSPCFTEEYESPNLISQFMSLISQSSPASVLSLVSRMQSDVCLIPRYRIKAGVLAAELDDEMKSFDSTQSPSFQSSPATFIRQNQTTAAETSSLEDLGFLGVSLLLLPSLIPSQRRVTKLKN